MEIRLRYVAGDDRDQGGRMWWITNIVKRVGTTGAIEGIRAEQEACRIALARVDALARRTTIPPRTRRPRSTAA